MSGAEACAARRPVPPATGGGPRRDLLEAPFFARSVHDVAADLVGCALLFDGVGGVIVETESYDASDPACHAYGGPTPRSEVLFGPPGRAYVYFSYGIHSLLNAVCEPEGERRGGADPRHRAAVGHRRDAPAARARASFATSARARES